MIISHPGKKNKIAEREKKLLRNFGKKFWKK